MTHSETLDNRYDVISHLGKGTMGSVYLVKRKSDEKELVVKKLIITSTSGLSESSAREIFQREFELLKRFSHPGLPEVYDTFRQDEQDYLALEYIKGETLEDIINKNNEPFPVVQALKWVIEIAEILDYLHNSFEAPVVYKDLKPSNIIITPEGKPRLIDFGTSRYYNPDKNSDTHRLGTPGYAAPEQYQKKGQTTPQSDLFALGVILFQLLTMYDPTVTPLKFPSMRSLNPSIPDRLEKIIKKSIQLEPLNRYISVMELKEELEKYVGIKKTVSSYSSYKAVNTADSKVYTWDSLNPVIITFVRQFAMMLNSGLTVMSGLDRLYEGAKNCKLRKILNPLREEVKNGSDLYDAFGRIPVMLPPLFINMIKAGERTENLKGTINKLADLMEIDLKLEKQFYRVTKSLFIGLIMITGIVLYTFTSILPAFIDLFEGMDIALPLLTRILIFITKTINNPFFRLSFITILIIIIAAFNSRKGKILYDRIKLYIPVMGPLYKKAAISRFCRAFGALNSSNIPVRDSLNIAAKSTGNKFITQKIEANNIITGGNIALSLEMTGFFPEMIYQSIETEEENGKLAETFFKISDDYNTIIKFRLEKLLPIVKTILIILTVLAIVGFIGDWIFMPHYYT
ncbi:MAG: type II secretion system F family protein [Candidatus Eremiobacterota bacterium]